jgi:pyruvate/oxaloacetate carboxyltransferase
LALGQYGETPAPISDEVRKLVAPGETPITCRPADDLKPELENARKEAGALARSDEDVLSYVLFPQVAREFFEWREAGAGIETEVVAAIAAAIAQAQPAAPVQAAGNGHGHDHDPWKMAGRQRLLRGR